jgi:hypothetical protein
MILNMHSGVWGSLKGVVTKGSCGMQQHKGGVMVVSFIFVQVSISCSGSIRKTSAKAIVGVHCGYNH